MSNCTAFSDIRQLTHGDLGFGSTLRDVPGNSCGCGDTRYRTAVNIGLIVTLMVGSVYMTKWIHQRSTYDSGPGACIVISHQVPEGKRRVHGSNVWTHWCIAIRSGRNSRTQNVRDGISLLGGKVVQSGSEFGQKGRKLREDARMSMCKTTRKVLIIMYLLRMLERW